MTLRQAAEQAARALGSPWAALVSVLLVLLTPVVAVLWGWTLALLLLTTILTVKTQLEQDLTLYLEQREAESE
jgi:hypothetical protein